MANSESKNILRETLNKLKAARSNAVNTELINIRQNSVLPQQEELRKQKASALASDIPVYYHHTVRLKNSAGASFCFTAESKKNMKADSLNAIFALFANTDICGWGYKSATEVYSCIHIGTSSTDTTLANAVTGNTVSLADSGYDASVEDMVKEI